jgi:hypothetical protein
MLGMAASLACSNASLQGSDAGSNRDAQTVADLTSATDVTPTLDAGHDTAADGPAAITGRRSFVVTSMFMQQADAGSGTVPLGSGHRFTMVLDWDGRTAIVGANGSGGAVPFQTAPTGGSTNQPFSISLGSGLTVTYQSIAVTVDDAGQLAGTGHGQALYLPPNTDVGIRGTILTMALTGVPDTEPPTFTSDVGVATIGPFTSVDVTASEPLPPDSRLALVDLYGDRFDLPAVGSPTTAAFSFAPSPFRMWRYSDQYSILVGGVVDFAGNISSPSGTIVFTTGAPPPLAAADGFEGVTGATFGGAQVLSGTGAPTISGAVSLYIPSLPSTLTPGRGAMTQLALRLALVSTDTVVRFSYQSVNPTTIGGPSPGFLIGSEGGQVSYGTLAADSGPPTTAMIGQSQVSLGPVMTAQLALPSDAVSNGEITLLREVSSSGSNLPAPPVPGLIVDDLRAE